MPLLLPGLLSLGHSCTHSARRGEIPTLTAQARRQPAGQAQGREALPTAPKSLQLFVSLATLVGVTCAGGWCPNCHWQAGSWDKLLHCTWVQEKNEQCPDTRATTKTKQSVLPWLLPAFLQRGSMTCGPWNREQASAFLPFRAGCEFTHCSLEMFSSSKVFPNFFL